MTEQLRALVPGWVEWLGPLLFLLAATAIIGLVPVVAVRTAVRGIDPDDHWTEQARNVHAARVSVVWAAATVPAGIWLLSTITIGPVGWLPSWLFGVAGLIAAVLVVARVGWALEALVLRQPVPEWRPFFGGFLVRLAPLAGIIVLALAAPARLSSPWLILWILPASAVTWSLRYQLELFVRFGLAEPADEHLSDIVRRAAGRAGVDMPRVFIIRHHQPNAFAFPWRGEVAFTSRATAELSYEELESVAAHELGHLAESGVSSVLRQVVHFIWLPVAAIKPIIGSFGIAGSLVVLAVLIGLVVVVRRFAVTMEARSDEHAVAHVDESSTYGEALEKIYRIGLIPAVLRRSSHGQFRERMEAAGLSIDFEPPAPPSVRALVASTVAAVLVGLTVFLAPLLATIGADLSSPTPAHVALALGNYESWSLERLGQLADVDRDFEAAEVFYSAAVDASPDSDLLINLVYIRSVLGHCDAAASTMTDLAEKGGSQDDVSFGAEWVDWCYQQWGSGA